MTSYPKKVVFLSAYHDYRTKKRASVQQVADGAKDLGYNVSFVSTRYSWLSRYTGDSRLYLDQKANIIEAVNGVDCFLWKTPVHPFASRWPIINSIMGLMFAPYASWPSRAFDQMFSDAAYVVVESSVAAILLRRIRHLAPTAKIIYYATDRLDTVGAHPWVQQRLIADAQIINHVCLRSPKMVSDFAWGRNRLYRAFFGMKAEDFDNIGSSPYGKRRAVVSVGSMLFDKQYFQEVPKFYPDVDFHVIGCGESFEAPENVFIHAEMPFQETLPYVKFATVGAAPYRAAPGAEYLAESSLKMAQYESFALPAVCPQFAVGDNVSRSGYEPGNSQSMIDATAHALSRAGMIERRAFPTWKEVANQVLNPELYPEIKLG